LEKGEQFAKECMAEVGTNPFAVRALTQGDFSNNSDSTKCFTKCFFQKAGFMDEAGNLNEEAIVDKLSVDQPKEKIVEIVNKCKTIKEDNPCDFAFKVYECYKKNN
jgi:hypothetical protein